AEIAVAAAYVAVVVVAVGRRRILEDEAPVHPCQAIVVGEGSADDRRRVAGEVRRFEVVPAVKGAVRGIEPDRLEPDRSGSLGPWRRNLDRVVESVRRTAAASENAGVRGIEDHKNAVMPEARAI